MDITKIPQIKHTDSDNFFLLAGPCAIEGEEMAMRIAEKAVIFSRVVLKKRTGAVWIPSPELVMKKP